ncbi:MAG: CHAT domain-containing protein [Pseudomonadota bacterium]
MRLTIPTTVAVASLFAGLAGCSREPHAAGESVLLNERLSLVRGESLDTVTRAVIAPADGTCVAIVEEDDGDVVLELQSAAEGAAPAKVEVDSGFYGEGVEVAAVPVAKGNKLSLYLSMPPEMPAPAQVRTRIQCYARDSTTPETLARVAAYRAWSEATLRGSSVSEESSKHRVKLMKVAIAQLESPGGDARMAAWAHHINGVLTAGPLGEVGDGIAEFRRSAAAFAALKNPEPRNAARARFNVAGALIEVVNDATSKNPTPAEAKIESEKTFTELAAASSPLSAVEKARAVKFLGVLCFQLADYACATRYFEAAADASHKVGHRSDELSTLHNLAVTATDLGNYATAARYFDRVLPLVNKKYSPERYPTYYFNAGMAYSYYGDTTKAITCLLIALEAARERQSALDMGRVMYGLGMVYWRRGDLQQAGTFFTESLRQRRITSDTTALILSLAIAGRYARYEGRVDEALAMHREALERSATPDRKLLSKYEVALDYAATEHFDRAIAISHEALADAKVAHPVRRVQMQLLLAEYLISAKPNAASLAEADELSAGALKFALEKSDTVLEASARHVRARLLAARGDITAARREYESAIAVILDFRGSTASPELQATTLVYEQATFREYVDLMMREAVARAANRFAPASRAEEDALRVLELARSSSASPVRDVLLDPATQTRIDALLQQMAAKRVRIAALNDRATPGGKTTDLLQLEMSQLRAEVDKLRGGSVADTRATKLPQSVNRPWPAVAPGVTQLSYALGKRNAYLWARDEHGLRVAVLAATPARLEQLLAAFGAVDQVHSPARLEAALTELSANLLPPGTLDSASSTLEIVAEGSLGTLPFAALREPSSGKRVVETHAVRMVPSMFDVSAPASTKRHAMAFVGIAGNTGELRSAAQVFPSLPAARVEARAIASLFGAGNDAAHVKLLTATDGDADTIRTLWAGGADAVHFATHGLANLRYPSASLLLLPKGGGEEAAYLTAGQVQEWNGDADLVFLAACETAAGPARFAEGMSGLPRSFLGAGARGIVATLWAVEDVYESEFSVEFYRRFIASRDAEASLVETQRAWLTPRAGERASDHQQRLTTAWAHVLYARPRGR